MLPQPPKIFEHGQKVDVVAEGKKRYMAVFGGLTQDQKHATVRFLGGPWKGESLVFSNRTNRCLRLTTNTAIVTDRFPESDDFSLTTKDAPVKGALS